MQVIYRGMVAAAWVQGGVVKVRGVPPHRLEKVNETEDWMMRSGTEKTCTSHDEKLVYIVSMRPGCRVRNRRCREDTMRRALRFTSTV